MKDQLDKDICRLYKKGISLHKIAEEVGRDYAVVRYRAVRMNLYQPKHKKTKGNKAECTRCKQSFTLDKFPDLATRGCYNCVNCVYKTKERSEQYQEMVDEKGECCEICGAKTGHKSKNGVECRLAIDHCHKTGKIRGLLCNRCNRGIGYLMDDIQLLKKAIKYLESH